MRLNTITAWLLAGCLLATALPAQGQRTKPTPRQEQGEEKSTEKTHKQGKKKKQDPPPVVNEELQKRIEARIREMRSAIRRGMPMTSHVRVKVKLRNSFKLEGVVKNGRVIERVDGLEFVKADKETPGAGLRLWYYDNTNSYIFLPFEEVQWYKIGVRLTDVQLKEIEQKIAAERAAAELRRRERLAARAKGKGTGEAEAADPAQTEEEKAKAAEEKRLLALVEEFSPEQGWSEKKKKEIQLRKITVGAFPDEKSRRFLEVFDDWKKGLALKTAREVGLQSPESGKPDPDPLGGEQKTGTPATPPGGARSGKQGARSRY